MTQIDKILLSAGIHGNEKTGIFLIEKFQANPDLIYRKNFTTETLLINTKAIALNRRYYEIDLNRCFASNSDRQQPSYEQQLAQKISQQVKEQEIDFVLDFHTSTSNMGLTLLLSNERPFNLQLAAYLAAKNPLVKIVRNVNDRDKNRFRHIFPSGFTVEMGAIAPNVIDPIWFKRGQELVIQILDYIEQTNQQQQPLSPKTVTLYTISETVYFPEDSKGKIAGMVHEEVHGRDYHALNPGDSMLTTFDGAAIAYRGSNVVYPIFINEAAYWENKIAMYLTTKEEVVVPTVLN